jgi:hypothetical protein
MTRSRAVERTIYVAYATPVALRGSSNDLHELIGQYGNKQMPIDA